jgi:FMN phosphatase YigB (HAD superfamily)
MGQKTLFLDLDGTLWDERPARRAIEGALSSEQRQALPAVAAAIRRRQGYYTWVEVFREFALDYSLLLAQNARLIRPYAGVPQVLGALAADWSVWLVTDGGLGYTLFKVERLAIGLFLTRILTSDLMGTMKDDPAWWSRALEEAGCPAGEAAAVGDNPWDVRIPAAMGMKAVQVLRSARVDQHASTPGVVRCRSVSELPRLLGGGDLLTKSIRRVEDS